MPQLFWPPGHQPTAMPADAMAMNQSKDTPPSGTIATMGKPNDDENTPAQGGDSGADDNGDSFPEHSLPPPPSLSATKISASGNRTSTLATLAGVAGNVLEWYDFAIFGYFSDVIGDVFFPPQSGHAALAESFAVFGGAFLARPLGGLITGWQGDSYGRKHALVTSISLMAVSTFLMGCLPSYETAGWISPVLLIIVRLAQGLSVGGQLMASLVFTVEGHPRERWGFYGAAVMSAANWGTLLGVIVSFFMRQRLSNEALAKWGWRVPFLSGILILIPAGYLHYRCEHDDITNHKDSSDHVNPIKAAFSKGNRRSLLSATLVPMLWAGGFYLTFVWMAIFMDTLVQPPVPRAFGINGLSLLLTMCLLMPVSGWLSDKIGTRRVMIIGGVGLTIFGPFGLFIISRGNAAGAFCSQIAMGILLSLWGGPLTAWLCESFPAQHRLTSVSIGYDIAHALAGGLSPFIATLLVETVSVSAPSLQYLLLGIVSLVGLFCAPSLVHGNEDVASDAGDLAMTETLPTTEDPEAGVGSKIADKDIT